MTLRTVNANWLEVFNDSTIRDVALITFTFANTGGTAKFQSGSVLVPAYGAFMGFDGVAPLGQQLDDYTRRTTQDEFICSFVDDEVIRDLFTTKAMRGSLVKIQYGDRNLVEGDLETVVLDWMVTDCVPVPGGFEVVISDPTDWMATTELDAFFYPRPIPEAARAVLDRLGLTATNINTDSFLSINHSPVAHLIVCRQMQGADGFPSSSWLKVSEPKTETVTYAGVDRSPLNVRARGPRTWSTQARTAPAILQELAFAGGAAINYNPATGKWEYISYDSTVAVDAHFTRDEIANFDQSDNYRKIINRMLVYGYGPEGKENISYSARTDATSSVRFSVGGGGFGIYKAEIKETVEWAQSLTRMTFNQLGPGVTTLAIDYPLLHGFSGIWQTDAAGVRVGPPSEVQQAVHQISAAKPAWFRITDHKAGGMREVVKATACAFGAAVSGHRRISLRGAPDAFDHWVWATYTVERADGTAEFHLTDEQNWSFQGTVGGWRNYYIYDITKEVLLADRVLQRFAHGCPVCSITVPSVYGERIRLGSLVSGDMPEFVADGVDGADSLTLFEVVGITPNRSGDMAGVDLVLSFVQDTALIPITPTSDVGDEIEVFISLEDDAGILGLVGATIHQIYTADGQMVIGSA